MKTGEIFKKLEFNHKRGRGDEEREEDLFVQFDKYENFRSRVGSSRAQEDATGIVFGP